MDMVDRTQRETETYERFREHIDPTKKDAEETGFCLYCGEPLSKGRRWCDAECRDEWESEQRHKNRYR